MTITMTSKHLVTIPKKITSALGLEQGSMFDVKVKHNRIELIPLEVVEKTFTDEDYAKLDKLTEREKGKSKRITKKFFENLKKGKV